MGYCPQVETDRVVRFFKKLTLPTSLQELINLPITTSEMLKNLNMIKRIKIIS